MFPLIPLFALIAILGGGVTLYWYNGLSKEDKEKADRLAGHYAWKLFNKSAEDLTKDEAKRVAELTRRDFGL